MLREIRVNPGDSPGRRRRWFDGDDFDLFVWERVDDGAVVAFQLTYDRQRRESTLSWDQQTGWRHDRVDSGEGVQLPGAKRSPLLRTAGGFPQERVIAAFCHAGGDIDPKVYRAVLHQLQQYRA